VSGYRLLIGDCRELIRERIGPMLEVSDAA